MYMSDREVMSGHCNFRELKPTFNRASLYRDIDRFDDDEDRNVREEEDGLLLAAPYLTPKESCTSEV